jgi:hypothetical protein
MQGGVQWIVSIERRAMTFKERCNSFMKFIPVSLSQSRGTNDGVSAMRLHGCACGAYSWLARWQTPRQRTIVCVMRR